MLSRAVAHLNNLSVYRNMEKENSRRSFLKNIGLGTVGMGMSMTSAEALALTNVSPDNDKNTEKPAAPWTFVSIPDFLNVDVDFPEPKWDDALDFILAGLKSGNPEFVLVAGDLVMGRWWRSKEQIEYMADIYYTDWTNRMKKFGLKYYVAVGDHDIGDNPWLPAGLKPKRGLTWDCTPLEFIPHFEKAFVKHLQMPDNGIPAKKGLDYYIEHENALIITLDVFDKTLLGEHGEAEITAEQIKWLDDLLTEKRAAKFKIIQAHTPIAGPVRKKRSSGLMYRGGTSSELWKIMAKHDIDLYLCGEVHAITVIEKDGIMQISHGSLVGYNEEAHYLAVSVLEDEMHLDLKWVPLELSGRRLQQSAGNEPFEFVSISPESKQKGFYSVGTATLQKKGKKKVFLQKTGYFSDTYEPQVSR